MTFDKGRQVLYIPDHVTKYGDVLFHPDVELGVVLRNADDNNVFVIYFNRQILDGIFKGWTYEQMYDRGVRTKAGAERTAIGNLESKQFIAPHFVDYVIKRWERENG